MWNRGRFVLLAALAWTWACGSSKDFATAPSMNSPLRPQLVEVTLNGRITDPATGGAIAAAVVYANGRYRTTTDASGNYTVVGLLEAGTNFAYTYVSADNYVPDYRYVRGTTHDVRLWPIDRIVAGESKSVTVAPDDTLCVNNVQDSIDPDYVCKSVYVMAPNDGAVTIEAVATRDGAHPPLEVETRGVSPCCSERMGNPTTIKVRGGTVIVVNVEMPSSSTSAQSFVVNSSPPR